MTNSPQIVQVNPVRAAEWALEFLRKTAIPGEDVERYLVVRTFLTAILDGQLTITSTPKSEQPLELPAPDETHPPGNGAAIPSRQ